MLGPRHGSLRAAGRRVRFGGHDLTRQSMDYYIAHDDQKRGPFALDKLVAEGLTSDSRAGLSAWAKADSIEELQPLRWQLPPPNQFTTSKRRASCDLETSSKWDATRRFTQHPPLPP